MKNNVYHKHIKTAFDLTNITERVVHNQKSVKSLKRTAAKLIIVLTGLFLLTCLTADRAGAQSMGISSSAITPDASSILEIRTTNKGLLLPRMTTTERDAITSPATGLIIYNTSTNKFNFYNGSAWTALFAGTSGVNSITGTTNRISIGGTASDPTIDISTSYAGQNSITTVGTIGTGTWNGSVISPAYGGTGINNGSKTITLGGNLVTSGAFTTTLTSTAATNVTLPTTGTLSTLAGTETLTNKTLTSPVINSPTGIVKGDVGLGNVPNIDATNASNLSSGSVPAARFGNLTVPVAAMNASGTPSSTTFLRGDGTWSISPAAISSLNTLTAATQTFATGTSGTDFTISSATSTHTFNLPVASATNTGKLSSTDWSTFNNKQSALSNSAGLAAALSDETGTGLAVFSTSPSLTTPTLGVASLTSGTVTGTGGAGFLELQAQSAAPTSGAANSVRLFSNTGSLAWKKQTDGFVRNMASTLTADRTYTLPDASGTIALSDDFNPKWAPVTKASSVTLTNAENFVLGDCTAGNITITLPASPTDGQQLTIIRGGTNENAAVTILPNSGQVIGISLTFWSLTERNHSVIFVYVAASSAWRIASRSTFSVLGYRKRGTTGARYYTSPNTGTALATAALVANTLYAMPLIIENSVTIDQLLINITTAGAGSSVRVGIYDDNNLSPDQKVIDCGTNTTATTGVKTYTTGLPISLPPGLYWLVAVCNGTAPTLRGFAVAGLIPVLGLDVALGTAQGFGYSVAFTYAALPTAFPASPTVRTAAPLPAIFVRYSD